MNLTIRCWTTIKVCIRKIAINQKPVQALGMVCMAIIAMAIVFLWTASAQITIYSTPQIISTTKDLLDLKAWNRIKTLTLVRNQKGSKIKFIHILRRATNNKKLLRSNNNSNNPNRKKAASQAKNTQSSKSPRASQFKPKERKKLKRTRIGH